MNNLIEKYKEIVYVSICSIISNNQGRKMKYQETYRKKNCERKWGGSQEWLRTIRLSCKSDPDGEREWRKEVWMKAS